MPSPAPVTAISHDSANTGRGNTGRTACFCQEAQFPFMRGKSYSQVLQGRVNLEDARLQGGEVVVVQVPLWVKETRQAGQTRPKKHPKRIAIA